MRLGGCRQPAVQSSHTRSCGPRGQLPPVCSAPLLLLLLLLASCICVCGGAPFPAQVRQAEQELQLWNEIDDACSHFLSTEPQPQASSALEELCFTVVGILQKSQGLDEKDNTKRFLFHYTKTHDTGNSDIMSSVVHPLLQLVPQLHARRMKRFKTDDELQGPGGIQSRGYFLFRPRNGRRSAGFR
ncbi:neuromedin-U isoform X1 [Ambystoma mexicanum]|uniref:neuromedin-U isoform X1 n=1 Tax=Ambystoma mexicanum TaxID=8296 RepID=UPI0037E71AF3